MWPDVFWPSVFFADVFWPDSGSSTIVLYPLASRSGPALFEPLFGHAPPE